MNGALIVDKPAGPTSHDVVARVRRALAIRRIGHTGTLDPLATGVLPLLIGRATRLAQFLARDDKAYLAGIRLGRATPTYDAEDRLRAAGPGDPGRVEPASIPPITEPELREALLAFHGTFEQRPPPFSAKKVGGTAAYVLARRMEPVEVRPVLVTVRELTLTSYADGLATVHVVCSSGFYVRSLAHDVGQRLGCGAHLESLRRLRAGAFTLEQAVPLSVIEEGEQVRPGLIDMSALLPDLPRVVVNDRGARRVAHGNALAVVDLHPDTGSPPGHAGGRHVCVLDTDGALLAVGESLASGLLQPVVVLV